MIKKVSRDKVLLIIILALIIFIMLAPYIITNAPFEYGGDLKPSGYSFYVEFKSLISNFFKTGAFPFYSWDLFLGTNFWSSKSFYVMGDIFNYLTLPLTTHFYNIAELLTAVKLMIAGLSFFYLLSKHSSNERANIIGALSYAFSAWVIFFLGQMSFVSFYCLMPLYFAAMEDYLQKDKKILFIFSSALLLFTNFYFFYTISIFSPVYFIYRYYNINKGLKGLWKSAIKLIFYYFIGVMITAVLTLPTALYLVGNDRVFATEANLFYALPKIYVHELIALFVPNDTYIYFNNVFETGYHRTRELTLWAGTINSLLLFQFITDKDKIYRKSTSILYCLLIIILVVPLGSSIMHGFSEASFRWTLLFIMMNIITVSRYLANLDLINKKNLIITCTIAVILVLVSIPFTLILNNSLELLFTDYSTQCIIFVISCLMMVLLTILVCNMNKRYLINMIIFFTVLEMATSSYYVIGYVRKLPLFDWESIKRVTTVLQDNTNELNDYLNNLDQDNALEYYRVFVPHTSLYWDYSHNQNIIYQLKGVMTYDSTYAPSLNDLKSIAPQIKDFKSDWIFNITDGKLIDFLNVKYAIVTTADELPEGDYTLIDDNYRFGLSVYLNNNYRKLGTTYNKVISYEEFDDIYNNNLTLLENTIIAHQEDVQNIAKYLLSDDNATLDNIVYYGDKLSATVYSKDKSFMVITLPFDDGWKILVNGQETDKYQVNGGFIGIPIDSGENTIDMYFIPSGFKVGFFISCTGILLATIIVVVEIRKKKLSYEKIN